MNKENINLNNIKNIYLIGIGGIGIGGIAEILINKKYNISGSDIKYNNIISKLISLGAKIHIGHNKNNIKNIDIIIKSSAINEENVELLEAKKYNIPIFNRKDIIPILIKDYYCISISGTHGKTTITSLISFIFIFCKFNITFINGGFIKDINKNCNLGNNKYFIIESDESDFTFLSINFDILILSNIDNDHLNIYNNLHNLKIYFIEYINKFLNYNKKVILCLDNNNLKDILNNIIYKSSVITYGFNNKSDIYITNYKQCYLTTVFKLNSLKYKKFNFNIRLKKLPGKHNVLNVTASIILLLNEGLSIYNIKKALLKFNGINRRFEIFNLNLKKSLLKNKKNIFISDYGHHPFEINQTINTIKSIWKNSRIIMIFQPHRFSRTKYLLKYFVKVLIKVDVLFILNIYSAYEKNIYNIDNYSIFNKIKKYNKNIFFIKDINYIINLLENILVYKDIVLIQGAGDIHDKIFNLLNTYK